MRKKTIEYKYEYVTDLPEKVEPGIVYIVGENGYYWKASFICPCGCGITCSLNLLEETENPRWKYFIEPNGSISISPSVVMGIGECISHFHIRKGKVIMYYYDE